MPHKVYTVDVGMECPRCKSTEVRVDGRYFREALGFTLMEAIQKAMDGDFVS